MGIFNFLGSLPQFKGDVVSSQLRSRLTEIKDHINTNNPSGLTFPDTTSAFQYQAFLLDAAKTGFTANHVLRSNVPLNHNAGNGTQYQALISNGDGSTNWQHQVRSNVPLNHDAGNGSAGQVLISDGDGTTSWVSITTSLAPSVQTTNFTTAANAQFLVSTGVSTITLHAPVAIGEQFILMPRLGTRSFATSTPTLSGAMQVNGAAIQAGYLNEDVRYNFISLDGTNWWVSGEVFDI